MKTTCVVNYCLNGIVLQVRHLFLQYKFTMQVHTTTNDTTILGTTYAGDTGLDYHAHGLSCQCMSCQCRLMKYSYRRSTVLTYVVHIGVVQNRLIEDEDPYAKR